MKNPLESVLLSSTEVGMLLYWVFASFVVLEIVKVPPDIMYSNYENPTIVSWNWSFLSIDILFAITGLAGRFLVHDSHKKEILSTVSLTLMFCAGTMAISFWVIEQYYDLFWWGINLWLILLSVFVLGRRIFYDH